METQPNEIAVELLQITLENALSGNIEPWDIPASAHGLSQIEMSALEVGWQEDDKIWYGQPFPLDAARFCSR
jgi:hypothetical protein